MKTFILSCRVEGAINSFIEAETEVEAKQKALERIQEVFGFNFGEEYEFDNFNMWIEPVETEDLNIQEIEE